MYRLCLCLWFDKSLEESLKNYKLFVLSTHVLYQRMQNNKLY